jgi:hypothetical protein
MFLEANTKSDSPATLCAVRKLCLAVHMSQIVAKALPNKAFHRIGQKAGLSVNSALCMEKEEKYDC